MPPRPQAVCNQAEEEIVRFCLTYSRIGGSSVRQKVEIAWRMLLLLLATSMLSACWTVKYREPVPVYLPFMKNNANECYYVDEFLPVPDSMTTGRTEGLALRYYRYKSATYGEYQNKHVVLAFYSRDNSCWSLFEEYFVVE